MAASGQQKAASGAARGRVKGSRHRDRAGAATGRRRMRAFRKHMAWLYARASAPSITLRRLIKARHAEVGVAAAWGCRRPVGTLLATAAPDAAEQALRLSAPSHRAHRADRLVHAAPLGRADRDRLSALAGLAARVHLEVRAVPADLPVRARPQRRSALERPPQRASQQIPAHPSALPALAHQDRPSGPPARNLRPRRPGFRRGSPASRRIAPDGGRCGTGNCRAGRSSR
jgi:hypothetical protein